MRYLILFFLLGCCAPRPEVPSQSGGISEPGFVPVLKIRGEEP